MDLPGSGRDVKETKRLFTLMTTIIAMMVAAIPRAGTGVAQAAPGLQYADVGWLIDNPCQSWLLEDPGTSQPRVICNGVFSGDRASINVPAPTVNARLPELGIVDLPMIVQLGWAPGTFDYADSSTRTIEWSRNRLEGYRVELSLSPHAGTSTLVTSSTRQGNLAVRSLDERLYVRGKDQYPAICAASSLDDLPANLGGVELCPASSVDAQLPGGLITGPSGSMLQRYNWDGGSPFRGGWFAGWSEWASVDGSGNLDGSPAYRVEITTGWALFARVQWDYHWRELTQTEQHCGWEYYGEPGWYWDWDEWPPVCIDVTTTYWQKYCPVNNPEPGCPTISYGRSSDWWQYIDAFEAHTIHLGADGFARYLDLVVLQSQPLLTGP
jgi:hypothetical protein